MRRAGISTPLEWEDHQGVVVLDPATLAERHFIPTAFRPNLNPILWADLLLYFPAEENTIRAVRLPD